MSYYPKKKPDLSVKREAQKVHALRRSRERLGVSLDVEALAGMVKSGKSKFVRRQSNRVTIHRIKMSGTSFDVVYDKKTKMVATILPKGE